MEFSTRRRRCWAVLAIAPILLQVVALDFVASFSPSSCCSSATARRNSTSRHRQQQQQQQQRLFSTTESKSSSSSSSSSSPSAAVVVLPDTPPLPPHTFAGQVERALLEKFEPGAIARVLQSWRLLDRGYVHREFVGAAADGLDPETSRCHQLAHSYVPGLRAREFWDAGAFGWCRKLQSKFAAVRDELVRVAIADAAALEARGNNVWAGALTADAASYGEGWKTLVLMNRGLWDPVNVNLFPVTAEAVRASGAPCVEVFFASMQPRTDIQPHSDFTNFVVTGHLPLVVPDSGHNRCRLTIGDTERQWIDGEVMLFDTSIMHEAVNDSDDVRYILMLRVWHPDLTQQEREALQFIYSVLEFPNLLSDNESERLEAERQVQAMRAFPAIHKGMGRKSGFGGGGGGGGGAAAKAGKKKKKGKR